MGRILVKSLAALAAAGGFLASCGSFHPTTSATSHTTAGSARASHATASITPKGDRAAAGSTTTGPSERGTPTTAPPSAATTPVAASCGAISGSTSVPGGVALVRAPATDHRRAAVVMLHGYTATTDGEEQVSGWSALLAGTDAVVAYPQGNPTPQGGYGWTTGTARYSTTGTDDVGVVAQLVDWLVHDECVDPNQVLVAGESNGSALGLLVACSGRLPVTARLYALAIPAVDPNVTARCAGAAAFPIMVFAGRLDRTVPYDGTPGDPTALQAPKDWFTSLMPGIDRCTASSAANRTVPDGTALTYSGCMRPSTFFSVDDGVHTWPGGPTGAGGLNPGAFPAAKLAWCASGLTATPTPVEGCADQLVAYGVTSR